MFQVSDTWFFLYAFLFLGTYDQDCLDFISPSEHSKGGGVSRGCGWQLARGLTSTLFGAMEYLTECLGIATIGFNVTSKVVDKEQRKRYDQETFEFSIPSPIFVPLVMAAIIHLVALFGRLMEVERKKL